MKAGVCWNGLRNGCGKDVIQYFVVDRIEKSDVCVLVCAGGFCLVGPSGSMVEHQSSKLKVAGSSPVSVMFLLCSVAFATIHHPILSIPVNRTKLHTLTTLVHCQHTPALLPYNTTTYPQHIFIGTTISPHTFLLLTCDIT